MQLSIPDQVTREWGRRMDLLPASPPLCVIEYQWTRCGHGAVAAAVELLQRVGLRDANDTRHCSRVQLFAFDSWRCVHGLFPSNAIMSRVATVQYSVSGYWNSLSPIPSVGRSVCLSGGWTVEKLGHGLEGSHEHPPHNPINLVPLETLGCLDYENNR